MLCKLFNSFQSSSAPSIGMHIEHCFFCTRYNMRYLIFLIIAFKAQLSFADNLTHVANDMEEYMTLRTTRLKTHTESTFAERKRKLNEAVDILEQLIKQGPEKCHGYLTDVANIRKFETNFKYSFQNCKFDSSMESHRSKLATLRKEFVLWMKKCPEQTIFLSDGCLNSLNTYDRRFGEVFVDFRNEVFENEFNAYACLRKLNNLVCYIIRDVGRLWSIECTDNDSFNDEKLNEKCVY